LRFARFILIGLAGLVVFVAPLTAAAQSCALCYTQAASAGSRMIQALQSGILILIAPPTLASIGMIFIVYRKRNQIRKAADLAEATPILKNPSLSTCVTTPWLPPAR
jgi:hypothetical protein